MAVVVALVLGFITYGLSILFYIKAQRHLGAAKTSTYYGVAPFVGVVISFLVFQTIPGINFWLALVIMILGTILAAEKKYSFKKNE
jgi:drug/metabolite transporter (DMT)-like permease